MALLQLLQADGLQAKRVASTNGGEYHSPCPGCGGLDCFIIWDKKERYFCRRCEKKGDEIQYLRDFHGLSYAEASHHLGIVSPRRSRVFFREIFQPKKSQMPSALWMQKAQEFIEQSHRSLFNTSYAVDLFLKRGFLPKTMKAYKVGWNPRPLWTNREEWGLSVAETKKLWIPRGLVLPSFHQETKEPIKLKIRRDDWHLDDQLPKYVEVSGGMQTFSCYGSFLGKPVMIVESEFDAILIQQMAGDLVVSMALGGASKRPDIEAHKLLSQAPCILFCLDVDSAGAVAYQWWRKIYPRLKLWLPPIGKSPGDAHEKGIDLHEWIKIGLY